MRRDLLFLVVGTLLIICGAVVGLAPVGDHSSLGDIILVRGVAVLAIAFGVIGIVRHFSAGRLR